MSQTQTASLAPTWFMPVLFTYGAALMLVGAVGTVVGGFAHWTTLIPVLMGAAVVLAGLGARRGHVTEVVAGVIALAVAVVSLLGTAGALPYLAYAVDAANPTVSTVATVSRAFTALISIGFIIMTMRSWWTAKMGW